MRVSVVLAVALLAACATEELATAPPVGVDFSGHWRLDEADSDDPMRLMQAQLASATAGAGPAGSTGHGGQQGGHGGPGAGGLAGPLMPSVTTLDEVLRWPDKDLTITQGDGAVTFVSHGRNDRCRPSATQPAAPPQRRDAPEHGRGDVPPPICGWDRKTLVVRSGDPEEDHPQFERRFSVSDDAQQLIEVVTFAGGRSRGFTASRVWTRVPPMATPTAPTAPTPTAAPAPRPQP